MPEELKMGQAESATRQAAELPERLEREDREEATEGLYEKLQAQATILRTWEGEIEGLQQRVAVGEWTLAETVAAHKEEVADFKTQLQDQTHRLQTQEATMLQLQAQLTETTRLLSEQTHQTERQQQRLGEVEWELTNTRQQVSILRHYLNESLRDIADLSQWIEKLNSGSTALLNSHRWKLGCAIGELRRRVLFQPSVLLASALFEDVKHKFQTWKNTTVVRKAQWAEAAKHDGI